MIERELSGLSKSRAPSNSVKKAFLFLAIFEVLLGVACNHKMSNNAPPPPPGERARTDSTRDANIADMRHAFACETPLTAEDLAAATAFIDGKIEMVRRDPHMTEAEKAAAIADLEARKPVPPKKP